MSYRILLADDHQLFRQGIKKFIEETEGLEVAGEAADGLELIELVKRRSPDMVILDISMPRLRGIEAAREIKSLSPKIGVLVLTMHKNPEYLHHALAAGADGYLLKEDTATELLAAIDTVRCGNVYLSALLSEGLTKELVSMLRGSGKAPGEILSPREIQVLKLVSEGKSSKEIGDLLCISTRTVEHHRASITRKLNIDNLADLIKYAIRKGYTSEAI